MEEKTINNVATCGLVLISPCARCKRSSRSTIGWLPRLKTIEMRDDRTTLRSEDTGS